MKKTIVIIGGGFGGVYSAKHLLKKNFNVIIINKENYFTFQPLLHEVATGNLEINDIIFDYYTFFKNKKFNFIKGEVIKINFEKKSVYTKDKKIDYDYLIYATGSKTNYYNIKGAKENTLDLKTLNDALLIKKNLIEIAQNNKKFNINIIGAGPTGIELIFEIKEFLEEIKKLDSNHNFIYNLNLINSSPNILNQYNSKIQDYTLKSLKNNNIKLYLNNKVIEIKKDIIITDKIKIKSNLTIYAAGIIPNSTLINKKYKDEKSNIIVNSNLQIKSKTHEFAIGDVINIENQNIPKLAQTAINQAEIAAINIIKLEKKSNNLKQYELKIKGQLISLGKKKGSGEINGFTIKGIFAWFIWRTIYLYKTPGLKNKFKIAISWTFNLFKKRDLTII